MTSDEYLLLCRDFRALEVRLTAAADRLEHAHRRIDWTSGKVHDLANEVQDLKGKINEHLDSPHSYTTSFAPAPLLPFPLPDWHGCAIVRGANAFLVRDAYPTYLHTLTQADVDRCAYSFDDFAQASRFVAAVLTQRLSKAEANKLNEVPQ